MSTHPEVLTYIYAKFEVVQVEYAVLGSGLEISLLVEDIVVREVYLVLYAYQSPIVEQCGGIVERLLW